MVAGGIFRRRLLVVTDTGAKYRVDLTVLQAAVIAKAKAT